MSIKQLIIDMSKEARAELSKLLDELDGAPEQEVRAPEAPAPEKTPAPVVEAEVTAPEATEAPAPAEAPVSEEKPAS